MPDGRVEIEVTANASQVSGEMRNAESAVRQAAAMIPTNVLRKIGRGYTPLLRTGITLRRRLGRSMALTF